MDIQTQRLPPKPAQAAIVIGFCLGTWCLVNGLARLVTGNFLSWRGLQSPWAGLHGGGLVLLGAAWMIIANLYLFHNNLATWKALLVLVVLSSWYAGWAMPLLLAQLVLLLLPATRAGIRLEPSPVASRRIHPG